MKRWRFAPLLFILLAVITLAFAKVAKQGGQPHDRHPDFATTCQFRDWVGHHADRGTTATQLDGLVYRKSATELDDLFANDEGATMCAGTAHYLHLKYLEAGYRSYTLGCASDLFTHAMTLVEIQRADGTSALIVQDPMFNISFGDATGEPLSIFEIFTRVLTGNAHTIWILPGQAVACDYLYLQSEPYQRRTPVLYAYLGSSQSNPRFHKFRANFSWYWFTADYAKKLPAFCATRGVQPSLLYAIFDRLLYVRKNYLSPHGDPNQDAADAEALRDELQQHIDRINAARD